MPSKEEVAAALNYFKECNQKYTSEPTSHLSVLAQKDLEKLRDSDFCIPSNTKKFYDHLEETWDLIDKEWENPSLKIKRLAEEGFTVYRGPSLRNMTYVSSFTESSISKIRQFIIETEIKNILEEYYVSNIGACNVRAYRYTHNPDKKNTHSQENFDTNFQVNQHKDGLLPGTIKIMIFKNRLSDSLASEDGVTELLVNNRWMSPCTGASPACLIFKPNIIMHRAARPSPEKIRDTIEITIIPKLENDFPVIASGAHAGYPKNLRTHWSKIQ